MLNGTDRIVNPKLRTSDCDRPVSLNLTKGEPRVFRRDAWCGSAPRGYATGFYRLAGPLLSRAVKKGTAGDLKRLKELLEAGRPSS